MWVDGVIASSQQFAGKFALFAGKGRPMDSLVRAANGDLVMEERNLILEEDRQG
jgi:hypothetical protein